MQWEKKEFRINNQWAIMPDDYDYEVIITIAIKMTKSYTWAMRDPPLCVYRHVSSSWRCVYIIYSSNLFAFPSCSGKFFEAQLPSSLAPGAKLRVKVETVFSHVLKPFPTQITQAERQLVVFQGNHYLYSPYPTRSQTTRVRLASKTVESYTKLGNPSKSDESIEYGPFKDVPPFSQVTDHNCHFVV